MRSQTSCRSLCVYGSEGCMNRVLVVVWLFFLIANSGSVAAEMPLLYDKEDTGSDCTKPPLPTFSELPSIPNLPDPFTKADGSRMTTREEWRCRRAEIRAMLEHYDVGEKPGKPSTFKATLQGNTITIAVGEGTNTFNMTATINRPSGAPERRIPAIIGINTPTGSLPAELLSKRGIATITYRSDQMAPGIFGGGTRTSGNFYKLYPASIAGYMIRWAWGVSRKMDPVDYTGAEVAFYYLRHSFTTPRRAYCLQKGRHRRGVSDVDTANSYRLGVREDVLTPLLLASA